MTEPKIISRNAAGFEDGYRYRPAGGGPAIDIGLPTPIGRSEWGRYADELGLSEEQRALFQKLHDSYLEKDWALRRKEAQPLHELGSDIASRRDIYDNLDTVDEYADLLRKRDGLLPRIAALENVMFAELQPHLTDEQALRLERVKMHRSRMRGAVPGKPFGAAKVDLVVMLRALEERGLDMTAADREAYEACLLEYDQAITPLVEQRRRRALDITRKGTRLRTERRLILADGAIEPASEGAAQELYERYLSLTRAYTRIGRRIHDLNGQFVERLAHHLPAETAAALLADYRKAAYRALYPDPCSIEDIMNAARTLESLAEEQRTNLDDLWLAYAEQYGAVARRMEKRNFEWRLGTTVRSGYKPDEFEEYAQEMWRLHELRRGLGEASLAALQGVLAPEQCVEIQPQREEYEARMERFESRRREREAKYGLKWLMPYD